MAEEPISAEIILYQAGGTNVPVEVRYQDETMWMPQAQDRHDDVRRDAMAEEPISAEIILYQAGGTNVPVEVRYQDETMWMPQAQIAELFGTTKQNVSYHLSNIFHEGELSKDSVVKEFLTTAADGKSYRVQFYDLDAIIAVGYRVNSIRATKFRQWATATLREYITKGFVLNDDMLANGRPFGKDYFDELLARIRDIRASERRVYQKITDIFQECTYDYDRDSEVAHRFYATVQNKLHYAVTGHTAAEIVQGRSDPAKPQECTYDYDRDSEVAHRFYATVQNKLHYAVTGHTAAEIVQGRSDPAKPHMGLTSWKGGPEGRIHSSDVTVAKNYLTEDEIRELNRLVNMFLDTAEDRAERKLLTSMADCEALLDNFLTFTGRDVLKGLGNRNKKTADKIAKERFAEFQRIQDASYENDFEKMAKGKLSSGGK